MITPLIDFSAADILLFSGKSCNSILRRQRNKSFTYIFKKFDHSINPSSTPIMIFETQ